MTVYLLVANILLINLLIASFNTIYNKVTRTDDKESPLTQCYST